MTVLQQQCLNQSQQHEIREKIRLNQNPNPKRKLLMKSASSTASGSGQQKEKRPVTDNETRVQAEDPLEMGTGENAMLHGAPSANTRRRMVL